MRITSLLLVITLAAAACGGKDKQSGKPDMKFDRTKWSEKSPDGGYTYRKQMVNDVLTSYNWVGVSTDSVRKVLGPPDQVEENIFWLYHYEQKKLGSFTLSTHSMILVAGPDSTIKEARPR